MLSPTLILLAALWSGDGNSEAAANKLPVVVQEVEAVSIAHLDDGVKLIFFWASVHGEWTCLDHRWFSSSMVVSRSGGNGEPGGDEWQLSWHDENESCFRVIRTKCWVETWEQENPLAEQHNRPWFARLLEPGLMQPAGR